METPDHTGNPKASKDYGAQIFHLDCSNTNQWAKLQHALPATRYLLKLQDTGVDCPTLPKPRQVNFPKFLLHRLIDM